MIGPGAWADVPGPVEVGVLAFTPDRELQFERPVAAAVVIHEVFEGLRFLWKIFHDELTHCAMGACEQRVTSLAVGRHPKTLTDLDDPLFAGSRPGNDGHQVAVIHLRGTGVGHNQVEHRLVRIAALVDLERGYPETLAKY